MYIKRLKIYNYCLSKIWSNVNGTQFEKAKGSFDHLKYKLMSLYNRIHGLIYEKR